ncbi:MAG: hypothetical protein J3R72DRAFT_451254 [Linnemannia gamsii]|nr:MAG: hypothetical protein J3R72DRAFT_451254 [Linnemannia gamsii]
MHRQPLHHGAMESATFIPLTLLIALSSLLLSSPSFAWTPIGYNSMAYATTFDQKTLYVQGGNSPGSTGETQFFSLDHICTAIYSAQYRSRT